MENKTIKELAVELTVEITAICDGIKGNVTKLRKSGSRRNAGPSFLSLFFKIMLDK